MSGESITIERVGLEMLDDVVSLFEAYRAFYKADEDEASSRAFLRARMERGESIIFLARVNGASAGFTQVYPSFSSVRLGESLILNDLYVDERYRRLGLGKALCERVVELARERGALRVELSTAIDNVGAQQLYEELGFVRNTTFYEYSISLSDR